MGDTGNSEGSRVLASHCIDTNVTIVVAPAATQVAVLLHRRRVIVVRATAGQRQAGAFRTDGPPKPSKG